MNAEFVVFPNRPGQRLCIWHRAQGGVARGLVVHLHAFAEEMNKSRRMCALHAVALAEAGFEVLQFDLLGCGDSSGDFGEATWQDWIADGLAAIEYARKQTNPELKIWLWGVRAGCLLATEIARRMNQSPSFLLIQAPANGKPQLQQFLRLKAAAALMDGEHKGLVAQMRQSLNDGRSVEVSGYLLSADLALGLEAATLQPPTVCQGNQHLIWFELSNSQAQPELSPAAALVTSNWAKANFRVSAVAVFGPQFWLTSEIEEATSLIRLSTESLLHATTGSPSHT